MISLPIDSNNTYVYLGWSEWKLHYSLAPRTTTNNHSFRPMPLKREQLPNTDAEMKKHQIYARTCQWVLLYLLVIGLVESVGRFSVVQNSTSTFGPVSCKLTLLGSWASCNPIIYLGVQKGR